MPLFVAKENPAPAPSREILRRTMSEGNLEPAACQTVVAGDINLSVDELGGIQLVEPPTSRGV
jgi:hypothetical protein